MKTICAVALGTSFLAGAFKPDLLQFLDSFNLLIHEAGHMIFIPFGEYWQVWGGVLYREYGLVRRIFVCGGCSCLRYAQISGERFNPELIKTLR